MFMFILQSLLLIAIAFVLGAVVGCWLQSKMGGGDAAGLPATTGSATRVDASSGPAAGAVPPAPVAPAETGGSVPLLSDSTSVASEPAAAKAPAKTRKKTASAAKAAGGKSAGTTGGKAKAAGSKSASTKSAATKSATTKSATSKAASAKPATAKTSVSGKQASAKAASTAKSPAKGAAKPATPKPATAKTATAKTATAKTGTAKSGAAKAGSGKAASAKATTKPAKPAGKDDLKQIKGVGRVIEGKLNAKGITSFAQIAAWKKADREAFSQKLNFSGRIEREDWVAQAKILAKGGQTEFSKRVARGEVDSSSGKKG